MITRSEHEHKLQQACVLWFRVQYPHKMIFAIPNGGERNVIVAKKLKDEGVLAGVADLFVPCANGSYHGLFIEMKVEKNKQTESQKHFQQYVEQAGYQYNVVRSFEEFEDVCNQYLRA